jgi:hypothetical protein
MQPIPQPDVFDLERAMSDEREEMSIDEHRARAAEMAKALKAMSEYGTMLWEHLDLARHYLYESLPSDPRDPGPGPHVSASPTGPDDDQGWTRWVSTYSLVTSALAGPHGDSGFGASEAKRESEVRRNAPNLAVMAELRQAQREDESADEPPARPVSVDRPAQAVPPAAQSQRSRTIKSVGLGVLTTLAIRGLLAGRRSSS